MLSIRQSVIFAMLIGLASTWPVCADDGKKLKDSGIKYQIKDELGYIGKKGKEKAAYDISGIACRAGDSDKLRCLVVNDEGSEAQFLTIEGTKIEAKKRISLLNRLPGDESIGAAPDGNCKGGRSDKVEFDGEGVAYGGGFFYVAGSHGCSRKRNEFKLSAMTLARIRVDDKGKPDGDDPNAVETTFRLGDALAKAPVVGSRFLTGLRETENGLNLEGIAVIGKSLFAGLRAPSLNGEAFIVVVPVDPLFAATPKHARYEGDTSLIRVKVGQGAGIRDLAVWDETRLLVLTGPAQEQVDVDYKLFLVDADPQSGAPPQLLGRLDDLDDEERCGKAEAVMRIGKDRVLVLFDSLKNGGPHVYEVDE